VPLYTVDRQGTLSEGMVCTLVRYKVSPNVLADHVNAMFPDGVSAHGERYLLRNSAEARSTNPMLELLFEYVRRSQYPHRPSRLQSLFGVDSLDSAGVFQERYCDSVPAIYQVEAAVSFRADMNLLAADNSNLVMSYRANRYWAGEPGPEAPFWERILKCPVQIKKRLQ
jgi:hypothetical protein